MLFNIHNGQMRFSSVTTGSLPIFRNKSPKKSLSFCGLKPGERLITYRADALGNIDVVAAKHIDAMVGLGYPIYNGSVSKISLSLAKTGGSGAVVGLSLIHI